MSTNAFAPRKTNYTVTYAGFGLGTVGKIDPSKSKLELEPIWRGTTGGPKVVLGDFLTAATLSIMVEVMDVTLAAFQAVCPWWSSGAITLTPSAQNVDMYTYGALLTLHPIDQGDTVTQDLNFPATVAITPSGTVSRDGSKNDSWTVEFKVYPDRDSILSGTLLYGYVGAVPS